MSGKLRMRMTATVLLALVASLLGGAASAAPPTEPASLYDVWEFEMPSSRFGTLEVDLDYEWGCESEDYVPSINDIGQTVDPWQDDAYDDVEMLLVNRRGYTPPVTRGGGDDTNFDVLVDSLTAPRVFQFEPQVRTGLTISQQYRFFEELDAHRTLVELTNTGAGAVTTDVRLWGDLGSDSDTTVAASSTGVTSWVDEDQWVVTWQDRGEALDEKPGDPVLTHVPYGPGTWPAEVLFSGMYDYGASDACDPIGEIVRDLPGDTDEYLNAYAVAIAPGETVRLMTFKHLTTTPALAVAEAAAKAATPVVGSALVADLTQEELASIVNWAYHPVTAVDDAAATSPGTPVDIDVLANDVSEDELTVHAVGTPSSGTAAIRPDGTVRYTPAAGFTGTATFTYVARTATGMTDEATVTVTVEPAIERLSGPERMATAIAVSQRRFGDGEAGAVVLARQDIYPDALAGSALAAEVGGPVLLTPTDALYAPVATEIARVLPAGGTVYLLGGTGALSQAVEADLVQRGFEVVRLAGAERAATAAKIAEEMEDPTAILLAFGYDHPDALAGAAAAAATGGVVLLTDGSGLPAATAAYLAAHADVPVFAIGGPAARDHPDATSVVGPTRLETAIAVAEEFFEAPAVAGLATGWNFPDALSGGADVGRRGGPILLTQVEVLSAPTAAYLEGQCESIAQVTVYGGEAAVSKAAFDAAAAAITCP
jgi:hypothetical protein